MTPEEALKAFRDAYHGYYAGDLDFEDVQSASEVLFRSVEEEQYEMVLNEGF